MRLADSESTASAQGTPAKVTIVFPQFVGVILLHTQIVLHFSGVFEIARFHTSDLTSNVLSPPLVFTLF